MKFVARNILWETDGENVNLPDLINLPEELFGVDGVDEEAVSDYISDQTGFLHNGFEIWYDYKNLVGESVCISLKVLFEALSKEDADIVDTTYGIIEKTVDNSKEWYDFKNENGTSCMDGEICKVLEIQENYIVLEEENEHIPFKLSIEEFETAVFIFFEKTKI